MPGLARKLLIFATVDGLVLQPLAQRNQLSPPAVIIAYETRSISTIKHSHDNERLSVNSFESHGIIGVHTRLLMKISLISILYRLSYGFRAALPYCNNPTAASCANSRQAYIRSD